ncbi:MAG: replicative DNA helicase [Pseudomonadota bacterium]
MADDDLTDTEAPLPEPPEDVDRPPDGAYDVDSGEFDTDDQPVAEALPAAPAPRVDSGLGFATTNASALKVPPHSLEAEQAVIGGAMLNNDAWLNVLEIVSARDFYRPQHAIIFEAMTHLAERDQPFDVVTIATELQHAGLLDKAGGGIYLAEIAENTPGASNVLAYARIVRERSTLRQLLGAANRIAESAFNPEGRLSNDLVDAAEQEIFRISEGRMSESGPQSVVPLLTAAVEKIETLYQSREPITGVASGFTELDKRTAGLQKSDLVIVAARPSMGKTALSVNIAEYAVMQDEPGAVLFFSMEQPADQIVMRMLSSLGRLDQTRLRTGDLQDDDWPRFTSAVSQLKDKKLYVDDTPALTPNEVRTRARRVSREAGGLRMIVVDYLQLMRGSSERVENRTNEISEISRSLKAIAKEMRCPLIALSQLNRGLESRENKRPVMSDLRESGAIEQDADVILFIYRDEVYHPDTEEKGIAEIIIAKQRNGPIGSFKLRWFGPLTKFENKAPDAYEDFV